MADNQEGYFHEPGPEDQYHYSEAEEQGGYDPSYEDQYYAGEPEHEEEVHGTEGEPTEAEQEEESDVHWLDQMGY